MFGGDVVERNPTVNETVGCAIASCVEAGLGCSRVETRDQPSVRANSGGLVVGCDGHQIYISDVSRTSHQRIHGVLVLKNSHHKSTRATWVERGTYAIAYVFLLKVQREAI